ncbi:response regulator [Microaerobacter geothermalis]|uniref:response regulator n=1 Tax=Microaerobacter geothermalis TaxID=674972 RepID=UPI001F3B3BDA|nr:response regulator [Microaerobacter geothermalis]MCF6093213.1 response regulator [Microaerobacter geothermalis]
MRYFITDDDPAIRSMLTHIIEKEDLGEVAGEAENGSFVSTPMLREKRVDVLLIDMLMPIQDGIETVKKLFQSNYSGKIVMISQVENKELIGQAYSLGIEYYITKPINRLEVVAVLQKVNEKVLLEKSLDDIRKSLRVLDVGDYKGKKSQPAREKQIMDSAKYILSELGILSETGSADLLEMVEILHQLEEEGRLRREFPRLQDVYMRIAEKRLGPKSSKSSLNKEMKASEQRIRRAISQALTHLASLGLTDYANPKFEYYAPKFFDFADVRRKMKDLDDDVDPGKSRISINIKKFIQVLYLEAKEELQK